MRRGVYKHEFEPEEVKAIALWAIWESAFEHAEMHHLARWARYKVIRVIEGKGSLFYDIKQRSLCTRLNGYPGYWDQWDYIPFWHVRDARRGHNRGTHPLPQYEYLDQLAQTDQVNKLVAQLSPKEKVLFRLIYWDGLTTSEIARRYRPDAWERVRNRLDKMHVRALERLRATNKQAA